MTEVDVLLSFLTQVCVINIL